MAVVSASLTACRSDAPAEAPSSPEANAFDPFKPRASVRVGEIVWVGPENRQAVVVLDSASLAINGSLVAVDFRGQMSAVLLPAGLRRGTSLGLSVEQGRPRPGHPVYIPGSAPLPEPGERLPE